MPQLCFPTTGLLAREPEPVTMNGMVNGGEHRFKPCKMEAYWLKEARLEDNWSGEMMSVCGKVVDM